MEQQKQAKTCYQLAINTKSKYKPLLKIVVKDYKTFCYAVSLAALINNKAYVIRRWDNTHQGDHVDVFKKDGSREKHLPVPWKIKQLSDIKKIYNDVVDNWKRYIRMFEESDERVEKKRLACDKKSYRRNKRLGRR